MKKRFENILTKKEKKNGISILICAVILTISFGTLVGCSMTKEDASGQSGSENILSYEDSPADNNILENRTEPEPSGVETKKEDKTVLRVMREDRMPATLFVGEGYSIYLTDGDWYMYAPDAWLARVDGRDVLNGRVQFWIAHFEDKTANQVKEKLERDGYILENSDIIKQENKVIYKVRLYEFENDVWGVYYCYPIQAEKSWGSVLASIVDTFAVSTND